MFKRVEKRRRKKQEEEKLGLDDDMTGIMGLHDTDSEESDSDQDSDKSSRDGEEDGSEEGGDGEGRVSTDRYGIEALQESEDEDEEDGDEAPMTVGEALRDPVYVVSIQPDIKACIVCPGKLLKNSQMTTAHEISHAHTRRFKRFTKVVCNASREDNAREFISRERRSKQAVLPSVEESSNRAAKRKARTIAIKTKRDLRKAAKIKARARKEGMRAENMQEGSKTAKPIQKKRKLKLDADEDSEETSPPKRSKQQSSMPHIKKEPLVLPRKGSSNHVKPADVQSKQVRK